MQLEGEHHTLVGSRRQLQCLGWPSDKVASLYGGMEVILQYYSTVLY